MFPSAKVCKGDYGNAGKSYLKHSLLEYKSKLLRSIFIPFRLSLLHPKMEKILESETLSSGLR